jgi:diguanylate cyclase (GGDEF)-like protein
MTTSVAERELIELADARDIVSLYEYELAGGDGPESGTVETLLQRVREFGDAPTLGRALCLLARVQLVEGAHETGLVTANEAVDVFAALDPVEAQRCTAARAEALRTASGALCALGRIAEALPLLEDAVRVAEAAVTLGETPQTLLRCLGTLGAAISVIGELDSAIEVYGRLIELADEYPSGDEALVADVMLSRSNLAEALHERAERRRAAGDAEGAEADVAAVRRLLNAALWQIDGPEARLNAYGRSSYFSALGNHLLMTGHAAEALAVFKRALAEIMQLRRHQWGLAVAHNSIARALLELKLPGEALEHAQFALDALERLDDSKTRECVLLVIARARHALGDYAAAYEALTEHNALRGRREAVAAHQYASHMTVKLGLERARAEAGSHRRIVAMLETLGGIGQEMTAKLDAAAVFEIFARRVGSLLACSAFTVWMLDAPGDRLTLAFGREDGRTIEAPDISVDEPRSAAACAVRERREIFGSEFTDRYSIARGTRPMETALFVPLIVAGRVLGVVSIQSERPHAYDENERLIFRTLSTYAAIALDNAAAYAKLEQTVVALKAAQSELALQNAEFARLSVTDALTGVSNRRYLLERAEVEIATMRRGSGRLAVAIFDVDHFKRVNDSYGHAVGDAVLKRVAETARASLRPADTLARIGGEEFALLLPGIAADEAAAVAERIRAAIASIRVPCGEGKTVRVTASFGVSVFEDASEAFEPVLSRADTALYEAKRYGRNRVHAASHETERA